MTALPRHSKSKNAGKKFSKSSAKGWGGLKPKDIEGLGEKIKEKFCWEHIPRPFQLEAIKGQLLQKDVLVHAGTGSGKTMIAAGPHALEGTKGMVTFMVSPLIALQEEQVRTFHDEFGLQAVAVNSVHGGCTKDVMSQICTGKWQIVLVSPKIILSSNFISNVFHDPDMVPRILSVIVDEAHVVSHWGASFRKEYGRIGMLRAQLPKGTPIVAMSATLSHRIRRDVLKKLQVNENDYISLDIGNDRPNISIVVRAIHNPMNTYSDLDFVVPAGVTEKKDIPKTMIYSDQINDAASIETQLNSRLPEHLRDTGIIRPYSAAFSPEHRAQVMDLFKTGEVLILICTDAAGMGCNTLDVDVVVQWKLPATVSTFVQRAGRAARDPTRTGLAVLLVEKSTYDADLSRLDNASVASENKKRGVRQSSTYQKGPKGYAIQHGVQRGSFNGFSDEVVDKSEAPLDSESLDEGLYTLVQTGSCRRKVLTLIYQNKPPHPTVPCCDICDPSLLNRTRPGAPEAPAKKVTIKTGIINENVQNSLESWRKKIYDEDFEDAMFGPSGILSDETVAILSSVGPILRLNDLERVVGAEWPWFGPYGDKLLQYLTDLNIPPMKPKPSKPPKRAEKRPAEDSDTMGKGERKAAVKKSRTDPPKISGPLTPRDPTAVNGGQPVASGSAHRVQALTTPVPPTYARQPYLNYSNPPQPLHYTTPISHHHHTPYYQPSTPGPSAMSQNPYAGYLQYSYTSMPPPAGYMAYQTPIRGLFGQSQPPSTPKQDSSY